MSLYVGLAIVKRFTVKIPIMSVSAPPGDGFPKQDECKSNLQQQDGWLDNGPAEFTPEKAHPEAELTVKTVSYFFQMFLQFRAAGKRQNKIWCGVH